MNRLSRNGTRRTSSGRWSKATAFDRLPGSLAVPSIRCRSCSASLARPRRLQDKALRGLPATRSSATRFGPSATPRTGTSLRSTGRVGLRRRLDLCGARPRYQARRARGSSGGATARRGLHARSGSRLADRVQLTTDGHKPVPGGCRAGVPARSTTRCRQAVRHGPDEDARFYRPVVLPEEFTSEISGSSAPDATRSARATSSART